MEEWPPNPSPPPTSGRDGGGGGGLQADLPALFSPRLPDGPLEMPLFQLIPSQRQLVFRGDRLPLQCTASYIDQSVDLRWRHNGHAVTTQEDRGVYVEETLLHDCCLLTRYNTEERREAREGVRWGEGGQMWAGSWLAVDLACCMDTCTHVLKDVCDSGWNAQASCSANGFITVRRKTNTCAVANSVEHTHMFSFIQHRHVDRGNTHTHRYTRLPVSHSHTHRSCDLPFVIGALDKDLKGRDRIGLAACQHLTAICGSSLELLCPATPSAPGQRRLITRSEEQMLNHNCGDKVERQHGLFAHLCDRRRCRKPPSSSCLCLLAAHTHGRLYVCICARVLKQMDLM